MWLKSKPDVEFQIQWHVIPEPPDILQGAATCQIQCHDSRATCHIAGCCHSVNSLSRFQRNMPHCTVQSPGEINVMIVPHCRVLDFHLPYWKSFFAKFYFFVFNAVWALTSGGFRIVSNTLVYWAVRWVSLQPYVDSIWYPSTALAHIKGLGDLKPRSNGEWPVTDFRTPWY